MWRAITEEDVESGMAGPELEAVRRAAGDAEGEDEDKLPAIIATVTNEVRAYIEDCPENRLGAGGTLPERVIHHAIAIIRVRLLSRLNMDTSDLRMKEFDKAGRFFERVSDCKIKIESPDPDDVVDEAPKPSVDVVVSTEQEMQKENLGGLF